MGAPPNLNIRLDNPINTIVDTVTLGPRLGLNILSQVKDPLLTSFGVKTDAQKQEEKNQEAAATEASARVQAYNEALADKSLDQISRQEITNLYNSGADSASIAAQLTAAREGKGVFAPRRVAQNEARIKFNQPGRSQILSIGNQSSTMGTGGKIGPGGNR